MEVARPPRIVVTVADVATSSDPTSANRKNALYADAVRRSGGEPVLVDASTPADVRREAFDSMDGLLLSGGADIEPARYGRAPNGAVDVEPERDALEQEAWDAAVARDVPVLGICRGAQAVNVFSGGTLIQHVAGHVGAGYGKGEPATHALRLVDGTRVAALLAEGGGLGADDVVNSYHHQAIGPEDLAPGLVAAGWSDSPAGPLVEALESAGSRWIVAVQCHPERGESTPPAFERLFAAFVAEARSRATADMTAPGRTVSGRTAEARPA